MKISPDRVKQSVSHEEWTTRVDLAACYRLMDRYGMTDLIYNHISARIPGTEELLINPFGFLYSEITASSLVKIDLEGEILLEPQNAHGYGVNRAGAIIHTAVHQARHDVECVIHTHTRAGMAVAATEEGLLPLSQTAMRFHGHVGYHDYEGPVLDLQEQARLQQDLGMNEVLILRNHGLLVVGPSIAEAFSRIYWLEMACKAQVDAAGMSSQLRVPPLQAQRVTAQVFHPQDRPPTGQTAWPALRRMLDASDGSYAH
jgi:ribulose-5-phosphate 4-epimerase/fuculose-1-phosphate aldolase